MPLRVRLGLLFALGTAVVIAVAGLGFVLQLRVSLDASLDPGLRTEVAAIADELSAPDGPRAAANPATGPASGAAGTPRAAIATLAPAEGIVQIRSLDGGLLAASPGAGTAPLLSPAQRQGALSGEVSFIGQVGGDRSRLLATTVAAPVPGGRVLVVVGTGTDVTDAATANVRTALLVGGPPAVLLAGLGAWLVAGATLRPVERMRRQAAEISDRDLARRLPVPVTRDEVAALGRTMNGLLGRLEAALERERGFVADAGHELRTPLAILRTELELAARPGRDREALLDAVHQAGRETDRLIRLAEDLLLLARADNPASFLRPRPVDLVPLLGAAARAAGTRRAIPIEVRAPAELVVVADPDRIRQALDNLLDNATRYAPPGSAVELVAASEARPDEAGGGPDRDVAPRAVSIAVCDRGPGFPEQFLPRAFERFQRAESARTRDTGGTGLGLSIVAAIATAHGGKATAANRPEGGAEVRLWLPAVIGGTDSAASSAE